VAKLTTEQLAALQAVPLTGRNRLKVAFALLDVTQRVAVKTTGITPQRMSGLVKGNYHSVTLPEAEQLADFFGCAIEDLFPAAEAVAS
jgi:DNA-binding XRE family transcriptional regulator